MLINLFKWTFGKLIGDLPEDKKVEVWEKFTELMALIVKSGAEGAVKGMKV